MKKQKSGLYRASVTVGGKRIYVSGHSQREIEAEKQRVRSEFETGCTCQDITWHDLCIKWYHDLIEHSARSTGTKNNIRASLNKWIIGTTDSRIMAKAIRRANLQQIIDKASASSPSSVRYIMVCLKQICAYGMELGIMSADHSANCTDSSGYRTAHRKAVTPDQVAVLMEAIRGKRIETAIMLLYYTGMRTGEMLALTWSDIDFSTHTIQISKSMDQAGNIKRTKTENSDRTIAMHE